MIATKDLNLAKTISFKITPEYLFQSTSGIKHPLVVYRDCNPSKNTGVNYIKLMVVNS